jgi:hypothetical protein
LTNESVALGKEEGGVRVQALEAALSGSIVFARHQPVARSELHSSAILSAKLPSCSFKVGTPVQRTRL